MTAPVSASRPPALSTGVDGGWLVTFTMPKAFRMETLPRPRDERVSIHRNPGGLFAARRFRGVVKAPSDWQGHEDTLRAALAAAGLKSAGPAITAQYNGPWVPGLFRRNEVLIPVACAQPADPRCTPASP